MKKLWLRWKANRRSKRIRKTLAQAVGGLLIIENKLASMGYTRREKRNWWDDFIKHEATRIHRITEVIEEVKHGL